MARNFSPFTRLTLLIGELKGKQLKDFSEANKKDLLYHTSKMYEGLSDASQVAAAKQITSQGQMLFDSLKAGDMTKAEGDRDALLASCKSLKDLV